ncbi:MAG: FHA domain-containing protein [Gemmataceae bacterium]|nr:FHA domain-containing protein [Gemmataceae bacterium]MDW8266990.1 FHA domain-containing protein [Gemmataceae bacterium]
MTAGRYLLWVDGVGGFLVCMGARITIGQAAPEGAADVPLYADISRQHARLVRDSEGYVLEAQRPVRINGRPVDVALLHPGDLVTLGTSCRLRFSQPVPISASARLDIERPHRLPLALDGVLLMAESLVLGPEAQVHVPLPNALHSVILFRDKEGFGVRYPGRFWIDGRECRDRGRFAGRASVAGTDFSLSLEPVEGSWVRQPQLGSGSRPGQRADDSGEGGS